MLLVQRDVCEGGEVFAGAEALRAEVPSGRTSSPSTLELPALWGRLVELSGERGAALSSVAALLLAQSQRLSEPCAWVSVGDEIFYAVDMVAAGVDVEALPVIRVRALEQAARACLRLAQSGGFALIVLDLRALGETVQLPTALLAQSLALAQRHAFALLFLTLKSSDRPSLDALLSLRLQVEHAQSLGEGRFDCELRALKDKRRGPHWGVKQKMLGPPGLW
ncbi:MAG: recombinase A [Myxococcota bacterium]|nr:recombinase A [Myxococcota bacterium]